MVQWHSAPETGCPFWLDFASKLDWDPRPEIQTYNDLDRFGFFQDEWLRGGPVRRWVPKAYANRPSASSKPAAAPASPNRASVSTTSASTTKPSATSCPTTHSPAAPTGS